MEEKSTEVDTAIDMSEVGSYCICKACGGRTKVQWTLDGNVAKVSWGECLECGRCFTASTTMP